jgi:sugar lactone lactonase YvrE
MWLALLGGLAVPREGAAAPVSAVPGYEVETFADGFVFPSALLRLPDGSWVVAESGDFGGRPSRILSVSADGRTKRELARGTFLATDLAADAEGTIYFCSLNLWWIGQPGTVYAVAPGGAAPEVVVTNMINPAGVEVAPDGRLVIAEASWSRYPGSLRAVPRETRNATDGAPVWYHPQVFYNPITLAAGAGGALRIVERGDIGTWGAPGALFALPAGAPSADVVLGGLREPHGLCEAPDGALHFSDFDLGAGDGSALYRFDPATGRTAPLMRGFGFCFGVGVDDRGVAYGVDSSLDGAIYRLRPILPPVEARLSIEPETLNLGSGGKMVLARASFPSVPVETSPLEAGSVAVTAVDGEAVGPLPALEVVFLRDGPDFHATFDRAAFGALLDPGDRTVTVTGRYTNGRTFHATSPLRVIAPPGR